MFFFKVAATPKQLRATHWLEWVPTAIPSSERTSQLIVANRLFLECGLEFLARMSTSVVKDSEVILRVVEEVIYEWVFQKFNHLEVIKRAVLALIRIPTHGPTILNEFIACMKRCSSIRDIVVDLRSHISTTPTFNHPSTHHINPNPNPDPNKDSDYGSDEDVVFALVFTHSGGCEIHKMRRKDEVNWVYGSERLRALLMSEVEEPWRWLVEMGVEWAGWIMELLQMELNSSRPLRAPFDSEVESEYVIDFGCEEVYSSPYRSRCLRSLRVLSKTFGTLPPSFYVRDVVIEGDRAVDGGGFADIWRGRVGNKEVCVKALRIFTDVDEREKILKEFCEEALVWKQLNHPNVLPFVGVNKDIFSPSFCLISPWMRNGNIVSYLNRHPNVDRIPLLFQVANGLQYLHCLDPPIIHGDIRGANILITDDLQCCLADFGLALVTESSRIYGDASSPIRGSTRWLAPELLLSNPFHETPRTSRDIYAFGCTAVEIFTGKPPFPEIRYDVAVIGEVLGGKRPTVPSAVVDLVSMDFWEVIQSCWEYVPSKRPRADDIARFLSFYT